MNVVIFGATGMVGQGVLLESCDDARNEGVLVVSRHPIAVSHPKIRVHQSPELSSSSDVDFVG